MKAGKRREVGKHPGKRGEKLSLGPHRGLLGPEAIRRMIRWKEKGP